MISPCRLVESSDWTVRPGGFPGSRRIMRLHRFPLLVPLGLALIAGCGSGGSENSSSDPAVIAPAREPLPIVPEQSEPQEPGTSEPVGAEQIVTSESEKSATSDDAAPATTEPEDAPEEPKDNAPPECATGANEDSSAEIQIGSGEKSSARYEFRDQHDPNGIGKFYMGREIAHVMGFAAAPWLERPGREKEEATTKLIKALNLEPGMSVADIGAGSGVLTLPISGRVGRKGKVFAVDLQQEMLDLLDAKLRARMIENVVLILGSEKTPRLDQACVDLAVMVDVYHEFAFPYEMLLEISGAMKPGGRVVFVEFRMEDPKVPIKLVHKMTEAQVKKEVAFTEFRLKWKETIGILPWQHVIVFEKLGEATKD